MPKYKYKSCKIQRLTVNSIWSLLKLNIHCNLTPDDVINTIIKHFLHVIVVRNGTVVRRLMKHIQVVEILNKQRPPVIERYGNQQRKRSGYKNN